MTGLSKLVSLSILRIVSNSSIGFVRLRVCEVICSPSAITDKLGGPNDGTASAFLASPKLQMIFGPWFNTELYLDGGFGFHSNDARGTTAVENFDGDTGDTVPTPASQRYGIEYSNYFTPYRWLTLNADYAWSNARYTQFSPAGQYVPEAVEQVFDAGISVHDLYGFEADLRFRYFGPRALTHDDSVRSLATALLSHKRWVSIQCDVEH